MLEYAKKYDVKVTEVFNTTFDKILNSLDEKKSYEAEGFVVNVDGYKFKLKYNDYCLMHSIINGLVSPNAVFEAVKENRVDDLMSRIPNMYRPQTQEILDNIDLYKNHMNTNIEKWTQFLRTRISMEQCKGHYFKNKEREMTFVMKWIQDFVPVPYRSHVVNKYKGYDTDIFFNIGRYKLILEYLENYVPSFNESKQLNENKGEDFEIDV